MTIQLGDRIKDAITGFQGIATGMTEYINGCRQWLIKPETLDKDGKAIDGAWIDEQTLVVVKPKVHANRFAMRAAPAAGGPDRSEHARAR